MTIWHIRLFFDGVEHNEDRGDPGTAKEWVRQHLQGLGHDGGVDWNLLVPGLALW
jgi:hypothetical protein